MSNKDIIPVFPTAMSKRLMKGRLKIAQKGHSILKKKVDVLDMRFRKVGKEIVKVKKNMGDIFKEASFLLAEARFVVGDFTQLVLNSVDSARVKVRHRDENIAGVKLLLYELFEVGDDTHELAGLGKGGAKLTTIKQTFANAIEILVELATLQTTFVLLDEVIKSINRRVNSLEHMYIPKVERTIKYIETEMDEDERNEFFRLKKVQKIKRKQMKNSRKEEDNERLEREEKKRTSSSYGGEEEEEDIDEQTPQEEEEEEEDYDQVYEDEYEGYDQEYEGQEEAYVGEGDGYEGGEEDYEGGEEFYEGGEEGYEEGEEGYEGGEEGYEGGEEGYEGGEQTGEEEVSEGAADPGNVQNQNSNPKDDGNDEVATTNQNPSGKKNKSAMMVMD